MHWCCFKFWLVWRFVMASLAHFNWFTAVYMNCMYFMLWKSYDLLWFWMHLILCICFKPLRSENYLLVLCNLILAKRNRHRNRSFKKIYHLLYNQRFTKSERALKRIETSELRSVNVNNEQNLDENLSSSSGDDDEYNISIEDEAQKKQKSKFKFKTVTLADRSAEHTKMLYPLVSEIEQQAMPTICVDRCANPKTVRATAEIEVPFVNVGPNSGKSLLSEVTSSTVDSKATRILRSVPQKILPNFVKKTIGVDSVSVNDSLSTEEKTLIDQEKLRVKEEKRQQKTQQKEINMRRKEELRTLAKLERRKRNVAAAIDLLLTWLRLMTTFAILVGNIHKTFMPKYLVSPSQDISNNPDLLMVFTITMSLDILLFWFMMFWTYCQQCRLCCRLGILRFWVWLMTLGFFGGICMYYPMHYIHEQLDMTWCAFMPGSDLNEYFDG